MKSFSFKKIMAFLLVFMLTLNVFLDTFTVFAYDAGNIADPLKLSGASFTTMLIKPDNTLWGFGANNNYQLGNGNTDTSFTPIKIMEDVTAVSTGGAFWFEPGESMHKQFQICFTAVIKTDNTLWTWGYNSKGQLGDGTFENRATPAKVMDDVAAISAGGETLLVIKTDGSLWGCGVIRFVNTERTPNFVKIMDNVAACSTGFTHMAAVKKDGTLWTWGDDSYGQLGTGEQTYQVNPVKVMDSVKSATCGNGYTFAIKSDDSLWAFGINDSKQLGNDGNSNTRHIDEGTPSQSIPVKIMDNVSCVGAAFDHAVVVKTDGTLWTWGANSYGKIGDGTHNDRGLPVKIMDGVSYASCGYDHTVAVKSDGSVWTWGRNNVGQLGDDMKDERQSPVKVMDIGSGA